MPILPKFHLSQDADYVTVAIKVPHIRVSGAEIVVDGHDFSFFCSPYLLKLTFPCPFAEDADEKPASYDIDNDNGTLTAQLAKKNKDEHFPDLDLMTSLMTVRKVRELGDRELGEVEVVHSENFVEQDDADDVASDTSAIGLRLTPLTRGYGFAGQHTRVLDHLQENCAEMFETEAPQSLHPAQRRWQRLLTENLRFDAERYLGDLFVGPEDPFFAGFLVFQPFWNAHYDALVSRRKQRPDAAADNAVDMQVREESFQAIGGLSDQEQACLQATRKLSVAGGTSVWTAAQRRAQHLQLLDMLFAFAYETRATEGDFTVESAGNVARLSASLHWLDDFTAESDDLRAVICYAMRRLCVYPYMRHWKLGRRVLADLARLLFGGKRVLLKALLQLKLLFERTDSHYLFNKLFLDDWIGLMQEPECEADVAALAKEFNVAKNQFEALPHQGKECMGLRLVDLEAFLEASEGGDEDGDECGEMPDLPDELRDCSLREDDKHVCYLLADRARCEALEQQELAGKPSAADVDTQEALRIEAVEAVRRHLQLPDEAAAAALSSAQRVAQDGGLWMKPVSTRRAANGAELSQGMARLELEGVQPKPLITVLASNDYETAPSAQETTDGNSAESSAPPAPAPAPAPAL